ncbi:hypothetical protein [Stenotrophomonas virus Jojan60]|nr:hypothetical protein [Stenotrophomonas virus Jojan60]
MTLALAGFDSFDPPTPGTRFDHEDVAIEYVCEVYFNYNEPTLDGEYEWMLLRSDNDTPFDIPYEDFSSTSVAAHRFIRNEFDGISHDTINSGYLLKMTDDGDGAHIFRHWGQ